MAYTVGIYLHGDCLVPDVVSKHLGVVPTKSWLKGQERPPKGRAIKTKSGLWELDIEIESSELDDYIKELMGQLRLKAVQNIFEIPGVESAVFDVLYLAEASQSSHKTQISPDNLRQIAELGLTLLITFGIVSED
jgi:Domain of unknown function (DUF4279)